MSWVISHKCTYFARKFTDSINIIISSRIIQVDTGIHHHTVVDTGTQTKILEQVEHIMKIVEFIED